MRVIIVVVLCTHVYGCGALSGRDLSLAGGVQKFNERRAATRARAAQLEAQENADLQARLNLNVKPLPPRRELLQVRVPPGVALDDIVDGVVATSIAGLSNAPFSAPTRGNTSAGGTVNLRSLESQARALDKRIELTMRERRTRQSDYDVEKLRLEQLEARHAKARDLLLQEFKISYEKMLQEMLAGLEAQHAEAEPATILGLTENNEFGLLAMFGRNELARPDEYVSLQESFLFVGNDITTGVALGRMDDLAGEVSSRSLSVNLDGLRLPTALKSLARSIGLPIFLSPAVGAANNKVNLDISRADALDIFDILIDNYGLAMAYDRKMEVARFYTREEFGGRVTNALAAAEVHNRRARNYRKISSLEKDTAAIRQLYQAYFQSPDDDGRARSLTNDAIIETQHSPLISAAIVQFKETALVNEKRLSDLDLAQALERQVQFAQTQTTRFALDDINQALDLLTQDKLAAQTKITEIQAAEAAKVQLASAIAETPEVEKPAPAPVPKTLFLGGPDAEVLRGRVINDANLKTTEPIYTEKFTIYNSEGANSCDTQAGASSRVMQIKEQLENYYTQLYPDGLIEAERAAERAIAKAEIEAEDVDLESDIAPDTTIEDAIAAAIDTALQQADSTPAPEEADEADDAEEVTEAVEVDDSVVPDAAFTNASFRRPSVTSVAETVIVTGFKHDVDLAASLIESLDKADKQVLVEVFMVNVVKDWQRQLQSRLQNTLRSPNQLDSNYANLPENIRATYGDLIEVHDNGLIGARGALDFASRAAAANSFTVNNFRLGLAWTIDFMETNSLGRKVSSPTILALNGCEATIEKSETRYLPIVSTSAPVVTPGGQTVPGESTTSYEERAARLSLVVTPTINSLNDHVRLKVDFNDDFFLTASPNSDKIQSKINTEFIAAPGDVIVLAGLYTEDNSKTRNGLPGTTRLPLLSSVLGTTSDTLKTQEMIIFLAPEVITPKAGELPVNSAVYYDPE